MTSLCYYHVFSVFGSSLCVHSFPEFSENLYDYFSELSIREIISISLKFFFFPWDLILVFHWERLCLFPHFA